MNAVNLDVSRLARCDRHKVCQGGGYVDEIGRCSYCHCRRQRGHDGEAPSGRSDCDEATLCRRDVIQRRQDVSRYTDGCGYIRKKRERIRQVCRDGYDASIGGIDEQTPGSRCQSEEGHGRGVHDAQVGVVCDRDSACVRGAHNICLLASTDDIDDLHVVAQCIIVSRIGTIYVDRATAE